MSALLQSFVDAIVAADAEAIASCLAPGVRLRALLPGGPVESVGADATAADMVRWFDGKAAVLVDRTVEPVADRWHVGYRVAAAASLVEQQAFVDVGPDGIEAIDLVCSGYRPVATQTGDCEARSAEQARPERFDAGSLGCADGLAQEFRRRITAVEVGDRLEIVAADPAAKEELPSLARLMGHTVHSVEATGDGRLLITVERGR